MPSIKSQHLSAIVTEELTNMSEIKYQHCRNCRYCKISKGLSSKCYQCMLKDNRKVKPTDICSRYKEVLV